ncbi:YhdP family protein [Roseomonas sp. WA12]
MTRLLGQVGGLLIQAVSFVIRLAMLAVILAGLGLAALGWRLAQGPLAIPSIPAVNAALAERLGVLAPGLGFGFGQAWVAWEGWKDGAPRPVFLRLDGLRAVDGAGATRASLAGAEVTVAVPPLLRGVVAPETVLLREPVALLRRDMAGALSIDLGVSSGPVPGAVPDPGKAPEAANEADSDPEATTETIARLLRAPDPGSPLVALRELRVQGALVQVRDEPLRLAWAIHRADLTVTRGEGGETALAGSGALRLTGQEIPVRINGRSSGEPPVAEVSVEIDSVSPPALAGALPSLAPLAMLDSALGARFTGRYDFGNDGFSGRAELRAEPGRIISGDRRTAFNAATVVLTGDGQQIALERLELTLPAGAPGRPAPRVTAQARADRRGALWQGRMDLGLDAIAVADLSLYWPPGVAEGARVWITENLTAGVARDGKWFAEGEAAADFSGGRLTGAGGTLRAEGLTVHWLRPIPPLEGVDGTVTFSEKDVVIQARAARQQGTALAVPEARIRIYDLGVALPDAEKAEIDGRVTGPLNDVLNLVRHPRLHLFEKRPLELGQAGGTVDARLSIGLPLISDLPIDQLRISVQGRVINGRIADVVAGQDVDRAQLDVAVDVNGMKVGGTARLGAIPGRVQAELDFRSGPQSQVTERVQVEGRATAADLARLGVDAAPYLGGALGFSVQAERRRSGEARAALRADLREARLALKPFDYAKPAGAPASAEAVVRLRGDALVAVEGLRIEGPDLSVRGGVSFGRGGALAAADVLEARIGPSRLSGRVVSPGSTGEPWDIRVRGTMLDARGLLRDLGGEGGGSGESTPLRVDAAFDRVRLEEGRELAPLRAVVFIDRRGVLRELGASGRGVGGGGFEAAVVPRGAGRAMEARAEGFGTLLRDLGLFDAVDGGALHVSGTWAGNAPDSPLTGVAELREFGVREAASIGKLLQALSIYGIAEAVRGPGLRFTVASAPFTLTPQALTLTEARAVSASLGITLEGRVLRQAERLDLRGTVVPSYAVNSALGRIPGIGRLFTAERNGGLFAANFRVTGKMDDPDFAVDALSLLAPGALRGLLAPQ